MSDRGLNQCQFKGNLARDPELRYTPNGKAVCDFTVACSHSFRRGPDQEYESVVQWVRCTAWGRMAEVVNEFCRKGSAVLVMSRYVQDSYEKNGVKKYSHKFIVNRLDILTWKGDRNGASAEAGSVVDDERDEEDEDERVVPAGRSKAG